jgi:deoxyribodipyrimidine photo-lyase
MPMPALLFTPTRTAGLERLAAFLPQAGRDYAARRNHDVAGHADVSRLSPWLRHRLLTEAEVNAAVLARHSESAAAKFLQEVGWRSYWKGWLELRPGIWGAYRQGLTAALNRVQTEAGLRAGVEAACKGETGIDAFDHWARELATTGYLHNHARMWVASIWIFTLRLPWELGADFFLRHLLDGDPASNTLSWRWVGGIQTRGKTYLARPDNIASYTGGRFRPTGLATDAPPLPWVPHPAPRALPEADLRLSGGRTGFLLHEDDLSPGFLLSAVDPVATALLAIPEARSPLAVAPHVGAFVRGAVQDAAARWVGRLGEVRGLDADMSAEALAEWATEARLAQIVTPYAPVGPVARRLDEVQALLTARGIDLVRVMRPEDAASWPNATKGFFDYWERTGPQVPQNVR